MGHRIHLRANKGEAALQGAMPRADPRSPPVQRTEALPGLRVFSSRCSVQLARFLVQLILQSQGARKCGAPLIANLDQARHLCPYAFRIAWQRSIGERPHPPREMDERNK